MVFMVRVKGDERHVTCSNSTSAGVLLPNGVVPGRATRAGARHFPGRRPVWYNGAKR